MCLTAVWLAAVAGSLAGVWRYKTTAGASAAAPTRWPEASGLARSAGRATLVMLAHPKCPCTRASLHELEQLMTRLRQRATAHVLFITPAGGSRDWESGELYSRAQALPGVRVTTDPGGARASLFGAVVSGQTLVYDPAGKLLFAGGITAARGHELCSAVVVTFMAALSGASPGSALSSDVYGCELMPGTAERQAAR